MNRFNFTPFPNLTTERLSLRQLKAEDENEFYILKSDERILKYLGYKAKTFDEAKKFLHRLNDNIARNESVIWGITQRGKDKLIGTICFWNLDEEHSKAEIGYELMPEYQGMGIMQEAMTAVIKYGFENMKLHTIEALPNPHNLKSVRLVERNNFVKGESIWDGDFEMVTYSLENN